MLASKFAEDSPFSEPLTDESGAVFLDSDPGTFGWLLGYLRRGCQLAGTPPEHLIEQVRADADYFGIDDLVKQLDDKLAKSKKDAAPTFEYKHQVLGPMDFDDDNEGQEECDLSEARLNERASEGWRVAHMSVDGKGQYVDVLLERRTN